jgi:ubiquinone/menaquinone biosynthesis C-methylase UbiE
MFGPGGPTLAELARQALSSTERGYDLLAPKFDHTPFRTPDEVIERALAPIGEVDDALDLCCGTGAGMLALAKRTRRRLVGLDLSAGMLEIARHALTDARTAAAVELVRQDVFEMHFDECFDVITCFGALGHLPEPRMPGLLDSIRAALRPGGRFVTVTAERPPWHSPRALVSRAFNASMHLRNALGPSRFEMYYLRFLLPEAERRLRWCGFEVERHPVAVEGPWRDAVALHAIRT